MISREELDNLSDIDTLEKVYDEVMLKGTECVPVSARAMKVKIFSKLCHDIIEQYLAWNDYIHSNNIMQLCKSVLFTSPEIKKPEWFIRYEIIVFGRRTPLYFIEHPEKLFDKIIAIYAANKPLQTQKLIAAVRMLFAYYSHNFIAYSSCPADKELFIGNFNEHFVPYFYKLDKALIPEEIYNLIGEYADYAKAPQRYYEPGITLNEADLWDEEEVPAVGKELEEEQAAQPEVEDDDKFCETFSGLTLRAIGNFNKTSIKNKLNWYSKKYSFTVDWWDDYDKLTNKDFKSMQYNQRIAGILAGPMPHSVKGKGGYSSGFEMMKTEPGYPPIVKCTVSKDRLDKVSLASLIRGLKELSDIISSR